MPRVQIKAFNVEPQPVSKSKPNPKPNTKPRKPKPPDPPPPLVEPDLPLPQPLEFGQTAEELTKSLQGVEEALRTRDFRRGATVGIDYREASDTEPKGYLLRLTYSKRENRWSLYLESTTYVEPADEGKWEDLYSAPIEVRLAAVAMLPDLLRTLKQAQVEQLEAMRRAVIRAANIKAGLLENMDPAVLADEIEDAEYYERKFADTTEEDGDFEYLDEDEQPPTAPEPPPDPEDFGHEDEDQPLPARGLKRRKKQ